MAVDHPPAPKAWRGRFYEDFDIGDVYPSRLGRTITETDNIWFTCLTLNTNQVHFNDEYAKGTPFGKPLVNSAFTLALVTGLTVPDTSENATANLVLDRHQAAQPGLRRRHAVGRDRDHSTSASRSRARTSGSSACARRGINQRREVVIEFKRTFMVYKRDAPEVTDLFPGTDADWTV